MVALANVIFVAQGCCDFETFNHEDGGLGGGGATTDAGPDADAGPDVDASDADSGDCDGSPCPPACDGGVVNDAGQCVYLCDGGVLDDAGTCVQLCDGSPCQPNQCGDAGQLDDAGNCTYPCGDGGQLDDAGTCVYPCGDGGVPNDAGGCDYPCGDGGLLNDAGVCVQLCDGGPCTLPCDGGPIDDAGVCIPDCGGTPCPLSCAGFCHGSKYDPAPPVDLSQNTTTDNPGVGAHQQHLAKSSWHHDVTCEQCHIVPTLPKKDPLVPTHMNGTDDVIWGSIAQFGTFDNTNTFTCSGTYCHGETMQPDVAGKTTIRDPVWTTVDGTQAVCGEACHTVPPGGAHPNVNGGCSGCHSTVIDTFKQASGGNPASATWIDASKHINGVVDVDFDVLNCTSCHGDVPSKNPAPPRGTMGEMQTTDPAVGAHRSHLKTTTWHRDVVCTDCHVVPTAMDHHNGVVDFSWGGPSAADGAIPNFDLATVTCSGAYCHGPTLISGGTLTTPKWNQVDGTQAACGTCHGLPPAAPHPQQTNCAGCHGAVIASCPPNDPANCVFQPDVSTSQSYKLHVNGIVEVIGAGSCDGCHGAPPNNGVHMIHAGSADIPTTYGSLDPRPNATGYGFNCGYCHPLDSAKHMNGTLEVELYNVNAPAVPTDPFAAGDRRTVKRENPAAAYLPGSNTYNGDIHTYTDGSCANVYCHSAENPLATNIPQPTQVIPATFSWSTVTPFFDVNQSQCCNGTADSYPDFTITMTRLYASPKWVGETHTGADKCGHCHAYPPRSAPPQNEGAGQGHAWIEAGTDGNGQPYAWENGHFWNMAAGWPIQCRRCHVQTVAAYLPNTGWHYDSAGGDLIVFDEPMAIADYTLHVNGRKDVSFDLSPAACDSSNPDLAYNGGWGISVPCLKTATFDPSTRKCSNVECHLAQTSVTWGAPYRAIGGFGSVECDACHQY